MVKVDFRGILRDLIVRCTSRKFLLALIAAVVAFGNAAWDWGLTQDDLWAVLIPILTFIGVEGLKDFKTANTEKK